ncbi:hypothetical protein [Amycolatopsis sacchari]|uniref:hypothetical protein n=1 Tax=Amycolatopsis sacchari TaxID=115433 RepID=UPI000B84230A|nr:hypothetical protein [Amycolatopsis sacchari]
MDRRGPAGDAEPVLVVFSPSPRGALTLLHRDDGVTLEMRSYDRKSRVPHDLAHAVTERELGWRTGVFGCLAAGALFSSVRVLDGRQRYDARERGRRLIAGHARDIGVAELLAWVVHEAVEHGTGNPFLAARDAWGTLREDPFPYDETDLQRATSTLRRLGDAWLNLPPGDGLRFSWPRRLTAPAVPPARPRPRRVPRRVR